MKIIIIFIFFNFCNAHGNSQIWQFDTLANAHYLKQLFYNSLDGVLKVDDSSYLIFTKHQDEKYWKRHNNRNSEILVSKVHKDGSISFIKKLDYYVEGSIKKTYNGRIYILNLSSAGNKGQYYHSLFIYDSNLRFQKEVLIPQVKFEHQSGFSDFGVDKDESVYLLSAPYFLDHEQENFTGSYLIKTDSSGNYISNLFFSKSILKNFSIKEGTIALIAYKQKLVYPFYQTDSIIFIKLNRPLDLVSQFAVQENNNTKNYTSKYDLENGDKVIFIDSIFKINTDTWGSCNKMALMDKLGNRKWTYITPPNRINSTSTVNELKDGSILLENLRKWITNRVYDTVCISRFDLAGNETIIKTFLDGANPRMERCFVSTFFEGWTNEIWIFYRKSYPDLSEKIYFEKLSLPKKN